MNYQITVTSSNNNVYKFIASDEVSKDFADFVDGVNKEQVFTFVADKKLVKLSRKYIEHVLFEEMEIDD